MIKLKREIKMNRIKLLFILPRTHQGGAETQMLYLLQKINTAKFQIYLGLLYEDEELKSEFESLKNIKIIQFNKQNKLDISIYFKIAKFVKKNNIDIIHSFMGNHHSYLPSIISRKVKSIGGIRSGNAYDLKTLEKFKEITFERIISYLTKYNLISNSYNSKNMYVQEGFASKKIVVIPNGIDYRKFENGNKSRIVNEFKLKNKIVLSMVGRLTETKNHVSLIKMFKNIEAKKNNVVLLIIGTGPMLSELKKLTEELKLSKKVIFTGNRKDIPDLLAATDIFVFPSLTEGWPNAVGEAMAAGLPVVSFDVGDVKKIIKNGHNGFIVDKDINLLMAVTNKLIEHPELRKQVGKNAKNTIKNEFSLDLMVKRYEQFYTKLIKK